MRTAVVFVLLVAACSDDGEALSSNEPQPDGGQVVLADSGTPGTPGIAPMPDAAAVQPDTRVDPVPSPDAAPAPRDACMPIAICYGLCRAPCAPKDCPQGADPNTGVCFTMCKGHCPIGQCNGRHEWSGCG